MKITSRNTGKKAKLWQLLAAVLLAGVLFAAGLYWYTNKPAAQSGSIDYSPATQEDKEYNDAIKAKLSEQQAGDDAKTTAPDSRGSLTSITPVITAYGQPAGPGTEFKLNGFAPEVVESDGICTLTLAREGKKVSVSKASLQNAQNTSCGQLTIPYAQLSPGSWQAVLSYSSSTSAGSSTKTEVEVR